MKKNKNFLIYEIGLLVDNLVELELPRPFVADKSGDQEEITSIFKNEIGNLEIGTWNEDNGGNREEDFSNQTYPLSVDLLTWNDLHEIKTQLLKINK